MRDKSKLSGQPKRLVAALLCSALTAALPAVAGPVDSPNMKALGTVIVWGAGSPTAGSPVPVVSDFIIDTGNGSSAASSGDADLISSDVHTVQTGTLLPAAGAWGSAQGTPLRLQSLDGTPNFLTDTNGDGAMSVQDGFAAFGIRANSDVRTRPMEASSSFYVASNVAFSIDGAVTPLGTTSLLDLLRIRADLSVTQSGNDDGLAFGSAAQFPHSAGATGGSLLTNDRLATMIIPRRVFQGNRRTAATRGTLAEQSVRFDLDYRYNFGNVDLSDGVFDIEAEVTYTVYVP